MSGVTIMQERGGDARNDSLQILDIATRLGTYTTQPQMEIWYNESNILCTDLYDDCHEDLL